MGLTPFDSFQNVTIYDADALNSTSSPFLELNFVDLLITDPS